MGRSRGSKDQRKSRDNLANQANQRNSEQYLSSSVNGGGSPALGAPDNRRRTSGQQHPYAAGTPTGGADPYSNNGEGPFARSSNQQSQQPGPNQSMAGLAGSGMTPVGNTSSAMDHRMGQSGGRDALEESQEQRKGFFSKLCGCF